MKLRKLWLAALMLLVLLCVSVSALAESLPADIAKVFSASRWKGWTAVDCETSGSTAVVIMQKGKTNCLCVLSKNSGSWKLTVSSDEAIYQGSRLPYRIDVEDNAFDLWYANPKTPDSLLRFAVNKNIWRLSRLEIWDKDLHYDTIHVYSDKLVFQCTIGNGEEVVVKGVTCRDLAYVDLDLFPITPQKAAATLSNPPAIPAGDLSCEVVAFEGNQRFPLYSGPGKSYHRPNNGKCVVSTNDWIQVFGYENDWLLVQYDRSSDKMRFGYIQASSLKKSQAELAQLNALDFAYLPVTTNQSVTLTDDPLFAQTPLGTIDSGRDITYLAAMGDWAHVEATVGKVQMRGFVPLKALDFPAGSSQSVDVSFPAYSASAQATLSADHQLTVSVTLSGDASAISGYQVSLNGTFYLLAPVYPVNGQPSLSVTLPVADASAHVELCPVDALGNPIPGQTLTLQP